MSDYDRNGRATVQYKCNRKQQTSHLYIRYFQPELERRVNGTSFVRVIPHLEDNIARHEPTPLPEARREPTPAGAARREPTPAPAIEYRGDNKSVMVKMDVTLLLLCIILFLVCYIVIMLMN